MKSVILQLSSTPAVHSRKRVFVATSLRVTKKGEVHRVFLAALQLAHDLFDQALVIGAEVVKVLDLILLSSLVQQQGGNAKLIVRRNVEDETRGSTGRMRVALQGAQDSLGERAGR